MKNVLNMNSQSEIGFYQELLGRKYPQDRIQVGYMISSKYRADFVIMALGISEIPIAVFEVKGTPHFEKSKLLLYARDVKKTLGCPFYLIKADGHNYSCSLFDKGSFIPTELPTYMQLQEKMKEFPGRIEKMSLTNFTVFKKAEFTFGSKLNIIIGVNGSGKTMLLKLLYAVSSAVVKQQKSLPYTFVGQLSMLNDIFNVQNCKELNTRTPTTKETIPFEISFKLKNTQEFSFSIDDEGTIGGWGSPLAKSSVVSSVFLPARELLSIFPRFIYTAQANPENNPYDQTVKDTIIKLGLPSLKSQELMITPICQIIEKAIGATFYLDVKNDKFMMKKKNETAPYEIDISAEGWRKLGEILQLLKNGAITSGSILFWDEPEANQNPALIRVLAQVIIALCDLGVQIFLTTHSLFLLRELEYLSYKEKSKIRYFSLHDGEVEQSDSSADLSNIAPFDEEIKQEDRILSYKGL